MVDATIVFEASNKVEKAYFDFSLRQAFAMELNATCDVQRVSALSTECDLSKNIERRVDRARKIAHEKFNDSTCLYVFAGALPLRAGELSFDLEFAFVLAFKNGRVAGSEFKTFDEEPLAFSESVACLCAGMQRFRPVVEVSQQQKDEAERFISTTFAGIHIIRNFFSDEHLYSG